jgi:short-subunit dehydrogenase
MLGQTVVVIGGSAGIGFETARLASNEGADVVLTARDARRLEQAARDLSARSSVALVADDAAGIKRFLRRAAWADRSRARRGIHAQVVV